MKTVDGCIARDILGISLRKVKPDCIPNVFHPNSTSGNNFFSINCEDDILSVSEYRIYDRWGNLLFERKNINPIDKSEFWNGTFNGRPVEQGVYVYYIELLYIDNTKETSAGDITVIR